MNQIFFTVISGVLIFTIQKIISDLWLKPVVEFRKCLAKIEVLLIRYAYLSQVTYGLCDSINNEIIYFRGELRNGAGEMISAFNTIPFIERWWLFRIKKIDVNNAKKNLIHLSNIVSSQDSRKPGTLASELMDEIVKNLGFISI